MTKEFYSCLFDSNPVPMWVVCKQTLQYLEVNKEALKLYGYSREQMLGLTSFDVRDKEYFPLMRQFIASDKIDDSYTVEMVHSHKGGDKMVVEMNIRSIRMGDKDALLIVGRNITLRKQQDDRLKNFNNDLQIQIEKKNEDLVMINQNLEAFNYSVSHDMQVYIRALEIYVDLIEESVIEADKDISDHLAKLRTTLQSLKQMIKAMLRFTGLRSQELIKVGINAKLIVEECLNTIICSSQQTNTEIVVNNMPDAYGDAELLTNVFMNLLSNAVKYSSKSPFPRVEVGGESKGGRCYYWVRDNGVGFDQGQSAKLFKPFSRLHGDREFDGIGAGLAIAERIVTRHGGKMWAESEKNQGAVFHFMLPAQ